MIYSVEFYRINPDTGAIHEILSHSVEAENPLLAIAHSTLPEPEREGWADLWNQRLGNPPLADITHPTDIRIRIRALPWEVEP